ncbi:hypothetical protein QYE76_033207 [Lolium multiflorum]|uniref:Transposase (putative) gypsy type domain-containing protein n=1 Tax=Lolium multiflorum TaxID=4521 RepID=A0AAD8QX49_LOLMU|nr:hypothetical protein QYE76_033207 [Lolium multiflorum]
MAAQDLGTLEWERSKISGQDVNLMKKFGLTKKKDSLRFPSEESYPSPPMEYRLHHLTPNSILHVSIFITLCECFLGVQPSWAPWKRIFYLRRNGSHNIAYNIGGVVICVRPDVEYFDVKFPDSVQGWRKRWLYVPEECADSMEYNILPFDGPSRPESEVAVSRKSAASSEREVESEASESTHSIPSAVSPRNKRKRGDTEGSGTSKLSSSPAEETAPEETAPEEEEHLNAYDAALVSSGDEEEEEPAANVTAPMSMSHTLALSETHRTAEETSTPHQDLQRSTPATSPGASSPKRARIELGGEFNIAGISTTPALDDPMMNFINLGTQFIGYRDTVNILKEDLVVANKRADDLAVQLEKSEEARKKAENDVSSIEDLRKRVHRAETALSDKITQQIAREENVTSRLESLNRRFVRKMSQDFELQKPEDDRLLDALLHSRSFPYFFPKKEQPSTFAALAKCFVPTEDLGLALRQENLKIGVEGTIALVAESQQTVDWAKFGAAPKLNTVKWQAMIRAAKPQSKKILTFLGYKPAPSSSSAKPEVK